MIEVVKEGAIMSIRYRIGDYVRTNVSGLVYCVKGVSGSYIIIDKDAQPTVRIMKCHVTKITNRKELKILREGKAKREVKKTPLSDVLKEAIKRGNTGTATFAMRFKIREDVVKVNSVCHAALRWPQHPEENEEIAEILVWVKGYRDEQVSDAMKGVYDKYLHWILNDSPWAEAFLTKDITTAYDKGCSMDVTKNISVILGAIIAAREGWEFQSRMKMFAELMLTGADMRVCYLVSAFLKESNTPERYVKTYMDSAHMVLHGNMVWKDVVRFFKVGYVKGLRGIDKDQSQKQYAVYKTLTQYNKDVWVPLVKGTSMNDVIWGNTPTITIGDGFYQKTAITKDGLNTIVQFITKELK